MSKLGKTSRAAVLTPVCARRSIDKASTMRAGSAFARLSESEPRWSPASHGAQVTRGPVKLSGSLMGRSPRDRQRRVNAIARKPPEPALGFHRDRDRGRKIFRGVSNVRGWTPRDRRPDGMLATSSTASRSRILKGTSYRVMFAIGCGGRRAFTGAGPSHRTRAV